MTNFTRVFQPIPSWLNWPITFNGPTFLHHRLTNTIHLTLKMTSAQVVETSVTNNSSFQNYPHPDDHTIRNNQSNCTIAPHSVACENSRLSFAPATMCETRYARSSGSEWEAAVFAGYLFVGERSVVKWLGLTVGDSFSPHPLPLLAHPLPTPQFFAHPYCFACPLFHSLGWSPPGKRKETAATQATEVLSLHFKKTPVYFDLNFPQ